MQGELVVTTTAIEGGEAKPGGAVYCMEAKQTQLNWDFSENEIKVNAVFRQQLKTNRWEQRHKKNNRKTIGMASHLYEISHGLLRMY